MRTLEMKIAIPEVNGGRCVAVEMKEGYVLAKFEIGENETHDISESELECRIDPNSFTGAWLEHKLKHHYGSRPEEELLSIYQEAKAKDRLHAFTCMTIDPSVKDGKLVYKKGLPTITGFSKKQWEKMLKDYNPKRNSRQMTQTEYACKSLYLIQKLVESGYEINDAWKTVCDNSRMIGHYLNSNNHKNDLEPTGSREICGFCDLGNTGKLLAKDPWEEDNIFHVATTDYNGKSEEYPVAYMMSWWGSICDMNFVGMLALD